MRALIAVALLFAVAPATAKPLTSLDLLTGAGLTPTSTVTDAMGLYGPDVPMDNHGVEFLAKGSSSDAWLIFVPGRQVYVDCDEAPANLPDDSIGVLCRIATGPDWRLALSALQEALKEGQPRKIGSGMNSMPPPKDEQVARPASNEDKGEDDDAFFEVARTFHTPDYIVGVEACPRVTIERNGNWHAAVIITWTRR